MIPEEIRKWVEEDFLRASQQEKDWVIHNAIRRLKEVAETEMGKIRKRVLEIQAKMEWAKKELPIGLEIDELAHLGALAIPWLCEELLGALVREEALLSLRSNELKNISSKEPFIGNNQ